MALPTSLNANPVVFLSADAPGVDTTIHAERVFIRSIVYQNPGAVDTVTLEDVNGNLIAQLSAGMDITVGDGGGNPTVSVENVGWVDGIVVPSGVPSSGSISVYFA
jgi:hypothetical protein